MTTKETLKPIYSDDHYRMKILVRDEAFQSQLKELHEAWKYHGVPVPASGFKRAKDYYSWVEKLRDVCNKAWDSQEAMDAMKQVDDDPSLSPTEKIWRRLEARESFLPPTPHGAVDTLLKAGGVDPKNERYRLFITKYIFFGQREYSDPFLHILWKRNKETDEMELFLKLEPHTKREHIVAFWNRIENDLKHLPRYRGKNKPWETFERDLQIYDTYEQVEREMADEVNRDKFGNRPLDEVVWQRLKKENGLRFENISFEQLRKAKSRIAALNFPVKDKATV